MDSKSTKSKAKTLVKLWLDAVWKKEDKLTDRAFLNEQVLINVFIKFNTPIPSVASVERLFSMGKDVLRTKRASLSDGSLERLVFRKATAIMPRSEECEDITWRPLTKGVKSDSS